MEANMTKERLLNLLDESLKAEESALPLYTKHISSTLFLSGFEAAEKERIAQILGILEEETSKHYKALQHLIEKIRNEDKDVY
jgi:hypothetical protein